MTKMICLLMAAVILLLECGAAFASETETVSYGRVNLDNVRFRKTCTTSADGAWWCQLDTGWVVEIIGEDEAGSTEFYKVKCNIPNNLDRNYTGYIMQDYVTVMTANEQTLWLKNPVQPSGDLAYTSQGVSVATQKPDEEAAQPEQATEKPQDATVAPADGEYGMVTADDVFFRQAPGSEIYWDKLPKGWLLEILEETTKNGVKWYKVQGGTPENVNGTYTGYVHSDFFQPLNGGQEAEPAPTAEAQATVKATPAPTAKPAATLAPEGVTMGTINTDQVFFRRSASTSAGYWCRLDKGWQLQVIDTVEKNGKVEWYKVKGGTPANPDRTYTGYIMAKYLTIGVLDEDQGSSEQPGVTGSGYGLITVSGTNVREEAKADSKALTALATGALVKIVDDTNEEWTKVMYSAIVGYVPAGSLRKLTEKEYNDLTGATPAPTQAPTQKPGVPAGVLGYIKLVKDGVNLRKTPNGSTLTPSSKDWLPIGLVLPFYAEPVKAGDFSWIKTKYNGMDGYIRSDCYQITERINNPSATQQPTQDTPAVGYIILTHGGVNLRSDPNMNDSTVYGRNDKGTVMPYYSTEINEYSGTKWYYVYSKNHELFGYVSGDFLKECNADGSDLSTKPVTPPSSGETTVTGYAATSADKVYVRESTSTSSDALGQVAKKGTVLKMWGDPVSAGSVKWIPVIYNDEKGYVHGSYAYQLAQWQVDEYEQSGSLPTPTPSPSPAPTGDSEYIVVTSDDVWVRSGAGKNYATISSTSQADTGDVFKFTKKVINESTGKTWYRIVYNSSTIAYIHGDYARVMTQLEYLEWKETQTVAPDATPTVKPGVTIDPPDEYRTLRLGSSGEDVETLQLALHAKGYLAESEITGEYLSSTVEAVKKFQEAEGITVDGVAGKVTQGRLYGQITGGNADGSSTEATLYPVEYSDWDKGDIQKVWQKGEVAVVTDVYTGISFKARRWSGYLHADVEPLTAQDTAAICRIYKVDEAQEISDRENELQSWRRRPLWVTIDGRTFAASMYGVPHNYPDGDTIADNNYAGQFCIHFVNSRVHRTEVVDYDTAKNGYFGHQSAIKYAYEHSISGTK